MDYEFLALKAAEVKQNAYAPYSNFHVGAALLTEDGKIYTGVNVETSSYGLTMCAERTAAFKAISEGERKFNALALATDDPEFCPPCGACRQVLWDLCGDIDIVFINHKNEIMVKKLSELIPLAFGNERLKKLENK